MQTRRTSLIEAATNTAVGYLINLCGQLVIFPVVGLDVRLSQNLWIGVFFTGLSLTRQYVVRRVFNRKETV